MAQGRAVDWYQPARLERHDPGNALRQESGTCAVAHERARPHVVRARGTGEVVLLEYFALRFGHLVEQITFGGERGDSLFMRHWFSSLQRSRKWPFARWRSTRR